MKILLIADTHGGARGDNPHFYTYQKKFYDNVLFPYIDMYKPYAFVHLGDIVENRKTMHYRTLKHIREDLIWPLGGMDVKSYWIAGNHDSHFRYNLSINAVREFVDIEQSEIVDSPLGAIIGGKKILMIPWICKENREECVESIQVSQADYCFGHFELKGFQDNNGRYSTYGDDPSYLRHFKSVESGHYHKRSRQGNITYVGSAFEYTWSDYGDYRGFSVFDTESGKLDFFRNPYHIFSILQYGGLDGITKLGPGDIKNCTGTYCRIFRKDGGGNDVQFADFVKTVEDVGLIDLTIVEKGDTSVMENSESIQTDSLQDIMFSYIDNQELKNPELIKDRFSQLYGKAIRQ